MDSTNGANAPAEGNSQALAMEQFLDQVEHSDDPRRLNDLNALSLRMILDDGAVISSASYFPTGIPPVDGPCLVLASAASDGSGPTFLPVGLGQRVRRLLRDQLPDLPVHGYSATGLSTVRAPQGEVSPDRLAELKAKLEQDADLEPEERARSVCDWLLDQLHASRCAIVPFVGGGADLPLMLRQRGETEVVGALSRIPSAVLRWVAAQRVSLVSHDVGRDGTALAPSGTLVEQRVRSYMAVPVVFRSSLLAVAYVDHLDKPRRFGPADQALFLAFAYELSTPLLGLLEESRRSEFAALRDDLLAVNTDSHSAESRKTSTPLLEKARRLAEQSTDNLLILGETGTGKEWLASQIHDWSGVPGRFVPVNVSAIPRDLFESELMGSKAGAFTGAVTRAGLIEEAEGGTLFLDEIGDLEEVNQVKLLRFLQDRQHSRVGDSTVRVSNARIIAATNKHPSKLSDGASLRLDLQHRFAPPLELLPLRERRDEVLPLARAWVAAKSKQLGRSEQRLDADIEQVLEEYTWPGNVRQLHAVLSQALVLSDDTLDCELLRDLLPAELASTPTGEAGPSAPHTWAELQDRRNELELSWARAALDHGGGKPAVAARKVGCPTSTLRSLLLKHGLLD